MCAVTRVANGEDGDVSGYETTALTSETWDAFAALCSRHGGAGMGGCWCTWFHRETHSAPGSGAGSVSGATSTSTSGAGAGAETGAGAGADAAPRTADFSRDFKRNLVETMVRFANEQGAMVIAEGVESAEEYAAVARLGVHLVQGFFVNRDVKDQVASSGSTMAADRWAAPNP